MPRNLITYNSDWIGNKSYATFMREHCKKGEHILEEINNDKGEWYLFCNACDIQINIKSIEMGKIDA